jgi:sterol desaturase/sphingolipid hydroxylase (fatty acid hydroxylase superfamily)
MPKAVHHYNINPDLLNDNRNHATDMGLVTFYSF